MSPSPPSHTLSSHCRSSVFLPSSLTFSPISPRTATLKAIQKSITIPDVDEAVQVLNRRSIGKKKDQPPPRIKSLRGLLLSGNNIVNLSPLTTSSTILSSGLQSLSLADNLIAHLEEILSLPSVPSLASTMKHLVVAGNPCMLEDPNKVKRSLIITAFRGSLTSLDGVDCFSLPSIDHAVKTSKFHGPPGTAIVSLTRNLHTLDRAVCALRIKSEIQQLYGSNSMDSSISESGSVDLTHPNLPPLALLLKVWSTSPTSSLNTMSVTRSLHRRLNLVISRTRSNRHNYIPDWSVQLAQNPATAFDDICADWDAAFESVGMPLRREVEKLKVECKGLTGEGEEERIDEEEYRELERTAVTYEGGEDEEDDDDDGSSFKLMDDLNGNPVESRRKSVPKFFSDAFEVTSSPCTPPGSIRSNDTIPAFDTEEEHRKDKTRETYDQLLKAMERGKLHEKGYKKAKEGKNWIHPPTLSSPPRKVPKADLRSHESPDLEAITQDISMSRTIRQSEQHQKVHDELPKPIDWDVMGSQDVLNYTLANTQQLDWALPATPILNPPARVAMPRSPPVGSAPDHGSLDTMKKLYSVSDKLFDTLCSNHDVHLSLFQINSALRKCADSFSAARSRYLIAIQAKFMYLHSTMQRWKKEDPKLGKAVDDAKEYMGKIEKIEAEKEETKYNLEAMKRHTAHLHKTIDTVRDEHVTLTLTRSKVVKEIEEANSRLLVDEREELEKERELMRLGKQFIARASMRQAFETFKRRVKRQNDIKRFSADFRKKMDYWDTHGLFIRWKNFLREKKGERVKVNAVKMYAKRKTWKEWRVAFHLQSKISRFQRLKILRKARYAVSHWSTITKRKKNVRATFDQVYDKAFLKNVMLRWKRHTRKSTLSKGDYRELSAKADRGYLRLLFMRLVRAVKESAKEGMEVELRLKDMLRKNTIIKYLDVWYAKHTVETKFRHCHLKRTFHTWQTAWTTRVAGEAFWNVALHHDDQKLMKKVFFPWRTFVKRQKKVARERMATRMLMKHSSTASVFAAFEVWAGIWRDWRKAKSNNFKALNHYFTKLSANTFKVWVDRAARSRKFNKVLPIFANMGNRGKFVFAWKKWKALVLRHRRGVSLQKGTNKIIANFLSKWMGKGVEKVFLSWKGFVWKRRRAARVGEIVRRRSQKRLAGKAYRSWLHCYVGGKVDKWVGNEGKFKSDKGRLEKLQDLLKESVAQTEEDTTALKSLESDLAKAQSDMMEYKNETDAKDHELVVLEDKIRKGGDKLRALRVEKLKKEKELGVTRGYFEDFKKRPEWGRWTLDVHSDGKEPGGEDGASLKELGEERSQLLQDSADYARYVTNLKERKKAERRTWKEKCEAAKRVAEEAARKRDEAKRAVEKVKLGLEDAKREYRVGAEDLGVVEGERGALADMFNDTLNKYDNEEKSLRGRLDAAEKREREVQGVLGRRRETVMGLRGELKVVKGKMLGAKMGACSVWKDHTDVLGEVAEAGVKKRAELMKEKAEVQRRRKVDLVKKVVEIWEDEDIDGLDGEEGSQGGEDQSRKSSMCVRSSRTGLSERSQNVMERPGSRRKRGLGVKNWGASGAAEALEDTRRSTKHAKLTERLMGLAETLADEGELLDDGEQSKIVEFERSIDHLKRRILKELAS